MIRLLTHLGGPRVTVLLPLTLIVIDERTRDAGVAALVANVLSHVVVQILKRTVVRARPCDANGRPLAEIDLPDPFSFPSGHAAASAAIAVSLTLSFGWLAPVALPLAALVGLSRVTLRVHYASDVVAGTMLGILGALAADAVT